MQAQDLATALATALVGKTDLYAAIRQALSGRGITPELAPAVLASAMDHLAGGDAAARETAERLRSADQGLLAAIARAGAGGAAISQAPALRAALANAEVAPLFRPDIAGARHMALLTRGEMPDMPAYSDRAFDVWFTAQGVDYGLGPYGEKRTVYTAAQFADAASPERRMVHLGIDVFAPAGTALYAPLPGTVEHVTYNADPLDYGHTLILRHDLGGITFHTLYGHLAGTLPGLCRVGQQVAAGQHIADLGDWHENGGWAAHVHFQIMSDMLDQTGGNFFGVGHESLWDVWSDICPDPNLILRLPPSAFTR
ncbi:hypothetical protein E7811_09455 [Aliigemmobacter aestuarii]|uniref:M23ase beta-sheet core domain-containing protein n=1 Tax=Aliigemmobacter aestuarii TaxID=1445661 RepID=A0A4S3MQ66_9RHOB|nr:peptidoglycan DD-metalloendopeptidase family protein [Gemmobacter aestuarii]THD83501.1 hypothetical protein E7811_09455 [Gemmobacter aestuarii]